ncbi:MAG: glycosyltransferase family 4 protein [Vicinamibacterales bacterium]
MDERHMFSTPYCVDNDYLSEQGLRHIPGKATTIRDIGLPRDRPIIVYSGKLIRLKRVQDLIQAIHILGRQGHAASLLVIGDGPLREELTQIAADANVTASFVGFQNQTQLARYYVCADVLVLPSSNETWGLVLNEAMALGLPVVTTTQVGASRDLVVPNHTGYTYQAGDCEDLARLLGALIGDEKLRRRLGEAARDKIRRYTYRECVAGVIAALELVTGQRITSRSTVSR